MKLNEKLIEKVRNAVEVEYVANATKEDIEEMLGDLLRKISDLEHEIDELKFENSMNNDDEIDFYDYYGVSPNDFH